MNTETLRKMLAWSAVVNYVILIIWFIAFTMAHDWARDVHTRWFKLSAEQFDSLNYMGMSIYKIGVLLFNIAPYLALRIIEARQNS